MTCARGHKGFDCRYPRRMFRWTAQRRQDLVRQGQRVEYFTVAWNSVEALVSIIAGLVAGSVALVGFGLEALSKWRPGRRCSGGSTTIWTRPGVSTLSGSSCESSGVVRCAGGIHRLRIRHHPVPARSAGSQYPRHRNRHFRRDRDAVTGEGQASGRCRNWEWSHARRFPAGGFLCLPFCDSVGRVASERRVGPVVG